MNLRFLLLLICIQFGMTATAFAAVGIKVHILKTNYESVQRDITSGQVNVNVGNYKIELVTDKIIWGSKIEMTASSCGYLKTKVDGIQNSVNSRAVLDFGKTLPTKCNMKFVVYNGSHQWQGAMNFTLNFNSSSNTNTNTSSNTNTNTYSPNNLGPIYNSHNRHNVTRGTTRRTNIITGTPTTIGKHGTRTYCTASHYSYDDPILFPNQSNRAHLHMFWGNTSSDAFTTSYNVTRKGASSCEGGLNNRSSYWMPALFDSQSRVVLPEQIIIYYKSFVAQENRHKIQRVPQGLQMLASSSVLNADINAVDNFKWTNKNGKLRLFLSFPSCVKTTNGRADGQPVLSSSGGTSHLAYRVGANCPASHPYLIPTLSYAVVYDIPPYSNWQLASDPSPSQKGSTLHADYIAGWDFNTMETIVSCIRNSHDQCGFTHQELPERFYEPEGERIYENSSLLYPDVNRTPFGSTLRKNVMTHTGH